MTESAAQELPKSPHLLGKGSYGKVVARNGQAVKTYTDVWCSSAIRECYVLYHFSHPNIIRLKAAEFAVDKTTLSFELLPYSLLDIQRDDRPMKYAATIQIVFDLLTALAALHSRGYIHGDVTPMNILIKPVDGILRAVLTDFGSCQPASDDNWHENTTTLPWAAPEAVIHRKIPTAIDMWAVGVLLYNWYNGYNLFDWKVRESELPALQVKRFGRIGDSYLTTLPSELASYATNRSSSLSWPEQLPTVMRELITNCLILDPTKRLSAAEALTSPLFSTYQKPKWKTTLSTKLINVQQLVEAGVEENTASQLVAILHGVTDRDIDHEKMKKALRLLLV